MPLPNHVGIGQVVDVSVSATDEARQWEGWGTALKPAHEPVIVARRPVEGTVAGNVLKHGTGALNIDGCRVPHGGNIANAKGAGSGAGHEAHNKPDRKYGKGLGGVVAEPHTEGRWPANVVLDETAAAEMDRQSGHLHGPGNRNPSMRNANYNATSYRVGGVGDRAQSLVDREGGGASRFFTQVERTDDDVPPGRWPANVVLDETAAAEMDRQSGHSKSPPVGSVARTKAKPVQVAKGAEPSRVSPNGHGDAGGASRYFTQVERNLDETPPFHYTPKASRAERNAGLDRQTQANTHPTVKPVALLRHLARLITPPNGTLLDPFAGSGSTLVAATHENLNAIGYELNPEYVQIANQRIQHANDQT